MLFAKLRTIGTGFTEEEYKLYRFSDLRDPNEAVNYLSHRLNNDIYRPRINDSAQQYLLEDKWITHLAFSALNVSCPETHGLYHPQFGLTNTGQPLATTQQLFDLLYPLSPGRFVLKPRGGRKGRNIMIIDVAREDTGELSVSTQQGRISFKQFIDALPNDAFDDYDGSYHGWLVQSHVEQHEFMQRLNPHTVNTFRIVTFLESTGECKVHLAALRLGRKGSVADNWDKGGLSVAVDLDTGQLGRGVFKPAYGGNWTSVHPDTEVVFEGQTVPMWSSILEICKKAAITVSGIRAVGWDIALTPSGPIVLEGNAMWGLPVVQVHTRGYLSPEVRSELTLYGANFPTRLNGPIRTLTNIATRGLLRSHKLQSVMRLVRLKKM